MLSYRRDLLVVVPFLAQFGGKRNIGNHVQKITEYKQFWYRECSRTCCYRTVQTLMIFLCFEWGNYESWKHCSCNFKSLCIPICLNWIRYSLDREFVVCRRFTFKEDICLKSKQLQCTTKDGFYSRQSQWYYLSKIVGHRPYYIIYCMTRIL